MRTHLGATWIDDEQLAYNTYGGAPSGSNRRGLVRFPDGALRIVRLGVPDTYWTIPAKPSSGRIGYVDVRGDEPDAEFHFHWRGGGQHRTRPSRNRINRRRLGPQVKI